MPTVSVGDNVSVSAKAVASKPKWIRWAGQLSLTGTAKLPSGHRRLVTINTSDTREAADYYVAPQSIGLTDAPWRATVFAPNGSYITSTGLGDVPTIGTPKVRIGVNAPSKAVIQYPVSKGSQNIVAPTFKGWSDGHTEAVSRGMEVTVEYRDASSGSMRTAFRGMVYQIESGETITLTAYDRLMDLAQYSDQYQSHAGYDQNAESRSRTASGSNYIYTFDNNVGTLLSAKAIDTVMIDCTGVSVSGGSGIGTYNAMIHPLPSYDGYAPQRGRKITKLKASVYIYSQWKRASSSSSVIAKIDNRFDLCIYQKNGNTFTKIASVATHHETTIEDSSFNTITIEDTYDIEADFNVTLTDDLSTYYVGIEPSVPRQTNAIISSSYWQRLNFTEYAKYTTSRQTVSGNYYTIALYDTAWVEIAGTGNLPEIAVGFEHPGGYATVSYFTTMDNTITIGQGSVPAGPSYGYIRTLDPAIGFIISYFISGAASIQGIVKDLISGAGLTEDTIVTDMGQTTYYSTSTYDYLTCIQELIAGGRYGIEASIGEAGKIIVRRMHTTAETPVASFTTDPSSAGEQAILAHDLTAHWMAEKATQAYIAENATSSGLPVALETDDALMNNSLVEIMQCPLRSVITDNSLGTHDLMANAAGGKMVQLHTNVFEGKMTLAGYRLDIWDFTASYCGGMPIGIDVPEYGAQGTAVPTEIIFGNGVTQVSLDNIRSAERNEISNSMSKTDDAISNNASSVPNSVYIFARLDTYETKNGVTPGAITSVSLLDSTGVTYTQSDGTYIKTAKDSAGYIHVLAVFRTADVPGGYAPVRPIERVAVTWNGVQRIAIFDNPKYAYGGQNVHVDIRMKSA